MIIPPAHRLSSVETYYFARKLKEVAQMNADGPIPVINLGIGSPDLSPPEAAIEALIKGSTLSGAHKYQSYTGIASLRSAWADWYQKELSVSVYPENEILPLIGSKEGIMHISMAFLNPGDQVLVPDPGYPAYTAVTKICGGEVLKYNLTADQNWLPNLQSLQAQDLSNVNIMWVNYPHMPTGAKASLSFFEKLIAFGRENKILICHDNPYTFILNDTPLSILQVPGAKDVALELTSLSKNYNMAGWRIGAITGQADYLANILKFKSNMDSGMFRPLQEAAVAALAQGDKWHSDLNEQYRDRREVAWQIMDLLDCNYDKDAVGLFVWGRIPADQPDAEAFCDRFLYENRVFLTPGHIFGNNGSRYIRISLCAPVDTLAEALHRLQAVPKTTAT